MSTVSQLLTQIDALYPNAESNTNKVIFMNMAMSELSPYFGIIATDETLVTVADDDKYTYPTGIVDITEIETLDVGTEIPDVDKIVTSASMKVGTYTIAAQPTVASLISVTHTAVGATDTLGTITITGTVGDVAGTTEAITPVANSTVYGTKYFTAVSAVTGASWVISAGNDTITVGTGIGRYDYERYEPSYKADYPMPQKSYYQLYSSDGTKSLALYPAPSYSGYPIRISYHKKLTLLDATDLDASPEFNSWYHSMLALYACYMLCSTGSSPDTVQADRFVQQYNDYMNKIWKEDMNNQVTYQSKRRENRHWRR